MSAFFKEEEEGGGGIDTLERREALPNRRTAVTDARTLTTDARITQADIQATEADLRILEVDLSIAAANRRVANADLGQMGYLVIDLKKNICSNKFRRIIYFHALFLDNPHQQMFFSDYLWLQL